MQKIKLTHEISKHGLILFVLFFAFLPLYVMLVISLKDNIQFVRSPMIPSAPYHWENWIKGWNLVGKYIANSSAIISAYLRLKQ